MGFAMNFRSLAVRVTPRAERQRQGVWEGSAYTQTHERARTPSPRSLLCSARSLRLFCSHPSLHDAMSTAQEQGCLPWIAVVVWLLLCVPPLCACGMSFLASHRCVGISLSIGSAGLVLCVCARAASCVFLSRAPLSCACAKGTVVLQWRTAAAGSLSPRL